MSDNITLEAIEELLDRRLTAQEQKFTSEMSNQKQEIFSEMANQKREIFSEMANQKQEIIAETSHNTMVLMESYFDPKFNLLADEMADIKEKLIPRSRVDDMEEEIKFLKSMMRQMNEEIQTLKKAQ